MLEYLEKRLKNTIACGALHSLFRSEDGSVYSCGSNGYGQLRTGDTDDRLKPVRINFPLKVIEKTCGTYHSLFLSEDGSAYGCGNNRFGQLGTGDTDNQLKQIKIEFQLR